ncbi:hypothetical protein QR685DRAFT_541576 [Neurospora intermedia]|uniref:Uncharacterized protein n=1 Tax=Neurospora intermedia TaxID=5142 RepID=A0ABR3DJN7_NEUIN
MPKSHVSQAKDVSSSREPEPLDRPEKLIPLIKLDNLDNFRLQGEENETYEDVLEALRAGRDYEEWAWWPYLIFPIPEEWYEEPDPTEKGKCTRGTYTHLHHIMALLQDEKWGTRLGYAVKLLDILGDSCMTRIIRGTDGEEFQKRRTLHLGRFLLTYNSVLAIPGYEDDQEAREICLWLWKGLGVTKNELVEEFPCDKWDYEKDVPNGKVIGPVDLGGKNKQGDASYFTQGMELAAKEFSLNSKPPVDESVLQRDRLKDRMGGKGDSFRFPPGWDKTASGHDDITGTSKGVRTRSYPTQHQRQPKLGIDYNYVPSSSTPSRRESAAAPDEYKHVHERVCSSGSSTSRHHYAPPTYMRDHRGEPSSSTATRRQLAPASGKDVLPEHVRRIVDECRVNHHPQKGEYHYRQKHSR